MSLNEQPVWLGLDIGGANLKAADSRGIATSCPFPLWQKPNELASAITEVISQFPSAQHLAVTMTGELADCFRTKREGVCRIVEAVVASWNKSAPVFYTNAGRFVDAETARLQTSAVAAANWHALASYTARSTIGTAILLDIGSTTTDIIPVRQQQVSAVGLTDTARLISGELVYTGFSRTPVSSLVSQLQYRGDLCGVARELFATMLDVYLILDYHTQQEEGIESCQTADGRSADKRHALDRLARMICADSNSFTEQDALDMARQVASEQERIISRGLEKVTIALAEPVAEVVVAGEGECLAKEIAQKRFPDARLILLSEHLNAQVAIAAPAFAVAMLAPEGVGC